MKKYTVLVLCISFSLAFASENVIIVQPKAQKQPHKLRLVAIKNDECICCNTTVCKCKIVSTLAQKLFMRKKRA